MASQESIPQPEQTKSVEETESTEKAAEAEESEAGKAEQTPIKSSPPKKPKRKTISGKEGKTKKKSKDTSTKKEPDEKTLKKRAKLVKKAKRFKADEDEDETALDSKIKGKEEKPKIITKKDKSKEIVKKLTAPKRDKVTYLTYQEAKSIRDKEKALGKTASSDKPDQVTKSSISKRRNLRLKLQPKGKGKSKDNDPRTKDLREESPEEKGHNKDLLDTVYHKMEIEVDDVDHKGKKEPEPVAEIKYSSYDDISQRVVGQVNAVIDSFHEIFQLYKPNDVMLSFNGGKDCMVVLHLLRKFYEMNTCLKHIKLPTLYITDPDAFEEVDEFVNDCEKIFNIELIRKPGPIKKALEEICQEKPHIKAVFMGCRRTDPYCQDLKTMQPTDPGWPPLMRINPIIDWKCRDVWQYLYMYNVPYCSLYQKGYTSIGNKKDTLPNPYLRVIDKATGSIVDYRPGHELIDNDELERAGRIKIPKEKK